MTEQRLERVEFLEQYAATHRYRLGRPASITVVPDADTILFLRSGPRSFVRDLYAYDVGSGRERVVITAVQLLGLEDELLSVEERARRERQRSADRGITSYALSPDGRTVLIPLSQRIFLVDIMNGSSREVVSRAGAPIDPRWSPDGKAIASVRDGDLYLHEIASGEERRLTFREGPAITYGLAEFIAQEEMSRYQGYWWSPDGRAIAVQRTDVSGLEEMHIPDLMHPERRPQSWPYPRAGKRNADVRLAIAPTDGDPLVWVRWDHDRHPYLATVRWERGGPLTIVVQDRAQTEVVVLAVDASSGSSSVLHTERDTTWINLDQEMPRWLPDGRGFLWTSERNGAWQLELRAPNGELQAAITQPGLGYAGLVAVDARRSRVFVRASAEPTEMHVWRVPLEPSSGDAPEPLTEGRGVHGAVLGRGSDIWIHSAHTLDGQWRTLVKRGATTIGELRSEAEEPPFSARLELRKVAGDLSCVVLRPRGYDPGRKHPVLVYVYGGPHVQTVTAAPFDYLLQQWMADQGFVVVAIDGRGTPGRGRTFERAIRGSFADVPLADQAAGLEDLLATDPSLDRERVGIYGWSFGGYLASIAVLRRPDLYRAAVAGAPVTDWRDYDTHYTERYLGHPDERPEAYDQSSVLAYAANLERPLLIVHGTSDDNVYFSHAIKLSDALFRAGRRHELLPLAGFTHMVPDPLVTRRLYEAITGFFTRHLSGGRLV